MAEKKKSFWERNKERNEEAMKRASSLQKAKEEGEDVANPEVNKQVQEEAQDEIDKTKVESNKAKPANKAKKSEPKVEAKAEKADPKPVAEVEPEARETVSEVEEPTAEETTQSTAEDTTEEDANTVAEGIKKDIENSGIMDTDEGREAQDAIDSNKPEMLMNIVSPEGKSVLKGSYDKDGNYVPYTYTEADTRLVKNPGLAGALTIVSYALSSLGVMAGIPIMPINFYKFGASPQEDLNRLQAVENDYAKLMNAGKEEATTTERTRAAEREANVADIDKYKNISDEDAQKTAQVNAATGGSNTQMDVQGQAQEFEAKQKELDREFEKQMANINIDNQIKMLEAQFANNKEMAELLYDQDVQRLVKKIQYLKDQGLSEDDIAKYIRSEAGTTKLQAGMNYAKQGTDMVASIINSIAGGASKKAYADANSDKSVKSYIVGAKDANSRLLSSLWKGRK